MTPARRVVFTAPRQVEIEDFELAPPARGEVQVEAVASGISAGTEMNVYRGDAPQWRRHRDPVTKLFSEGGGEGDWSYPLPYGYLTVGRVSAVGDGVEGIEPGALVSTRTPHQSHVNVPVREATVLGELDDPRRGLLLPNVNTALCGILDARIMLGDTVVVSGLGVIGLLVTQMAARSGAGRVIGVDRSAARRALAQRLGATTTYDPSEEVAERVREATGNRGADLVIEVSGAAPALGAAIRTVGYGARVIVLSWYGQPIDGLDLAGEFHHNRVQLISSQALNVNPTLGPLWTVTRREALAVELLGTLELAPLFTHDFPVADAAEAYRTVDQAPEGLVQCTFSYR